MEIIIALGKLKKKCSKNSLNWAYFKRFFDEDYMKEFCAKKNVMRKLREPCFFIFISVMSFLQPSGAFRPDEAMEKT